MRSATRRAKHVRFRRERVVVEVPPDEPYSDGEAAGDAPDADPQKIEVHVHLHRAERKKPRSQRAVPPALTGVLFDWDWYKERLCKKPRTTALKRWSLSTTCPACDATVPPIAQQCPRCGAPRSRPRLLSRVMAVLGLVSVGVVFALCAHGLGDSVPDHKPPAPLGQWSGEEYVIVEVPSAQPSPFEQARPPTNGAELSRDGVVPR